MSDQSVLDGPGVQQLITTLAERLERKGEFSSKQSHAIAQAIVETVVLFVALPQQPEEPTSQYPPESSQ